MAVAVTSGHFYDFHGVYVCYIGLSEVLGRGETLLMGNPMRRNLSIIAQGTSLHALERTMRRKMIRSVCMDSILPTNRHFSCGC